MFKHSARAEREKRERERATEERRERVTPSPYAGHPGEEVPKFFEFRWSARKKGTHSVSLTPSSHSQEGCTHSWARQVHIVQSIADMSESFRVVYPLDNPTGLIKRDDSKGPHVCIVGRHHHMQGGMTGDGSMRQIHRKTMGHESKSLSQGEWVEHVQR